MSDAGRPVAGTRAERPGPGAGARARRARHRRLDRDPRVPRGAAARPAAPPPRPGPPRGDARLRRLVQPGLEARRRTRSPTSSSSPCPIPTRIAALAAEMAGRLGWFEALLAGRDFLLGDELSAADVAAFPFLKYAARHRPRRRRAVPPGPQRPPCRSATTTRGSSPGSSGSTRCRAPPRPDPSRACRAGSGYAPVVSNLPKRGLGRSDARGDLAHHRRRLDLPRLGRRRRGVARGRRRVPEPGRDPAPHPGHPEVRVEGHVLGRRRPTRPSSRARGEDPARSR